RTGRGRGSGGERGRGTRAGRVRGRRYGSSRGADEGRGRQRECRSRLGGHGGRVGGGQRGGVGGGSGDGCSVRGVVPGAGELPGATPPRGRARPPRRERGEER